MHSEHVHCGIVCDVPVIKCSGGFRGGRAGSALSPPLGDGLTPSLTVMLANAKFLLFYC